MTTGFGSSADDWARFFVELNNFAVGKLKPAQIQEIVDSFKYGGLSVEKAWDVLANLGGGLSDPSDLVSFYEKNVRKTPNLIPGDPIWIENLPGEYEKIFKTMRYRVEALTDEELGLLVDKMIASSGENLPFSVIEKQTRNFNDFKEILNFAGETKDTFNISSREALYDSLDSGDLEYLKNINQIVGREGGLSGTGATTESALKNVAHENFVDEMVNLGIFETRSGAWAMEQDAWRVADKEMRRIHKIDNFSSELVEIGWSSEDIDVFIKEWDAAGVFEESQGVLDDLLDDLAKTRSYDEWKLVEDLRRADPQMGTVMGDINFQFKMADKYGTEPTWFNREFGNKNFTEVYQEALDAAEAEHYLGSRTAKKLTDDKFYGIVDLDNAWTKLGQSGNLEDLTGPELFAYRDDLKRNPSSYDSKTKLPKEPEIFVPTPEELDILDKVTGGNANALSKKEMDKLLDEALGKGPKKTASLGRFALLGGLFADLATTVTSDSPVISDRYENIIAERVAGGQREDLAWMEVLQDTLDGRTKFAPSNTLSGQWERAVFNRALESAQEVVSSPDPFTERTFKFIPEINWESVVDKTTQLGQHAKAASKRTNIPLEDIQNMLASNRQATGERHQGGVLRSRVVPQRNVRTRRHATERTESPPSKIAQKGLMVQ